MSETYSFVVKNAGKAGWIVEGSLPAAPFSFLEIVADKGQVVSRIARALERQE
jgi:hypothetical protein